MRELLIEIWVSLRKNKLRTFLTGFSVAWGIFMLIILLGSGNGLQNGVMSNFGNMAINSMEIYGGWTSMPYGGYDKFRRINLTNDDMRILKSDFDEVQDIGANGYYSSKSFSYKEASATVQLVGMSEKLAAMKGMTLIKGRFINDQDLAERRKVMVVDETLRDVLFKNEDPIGKQILSPTGSFTVIGVYETLKNGRDMRGCIPMTTAQLIFDANSTTIHSMMFTVNGVNTEEASVDFANRVRTRLSKEHTYDPNDNNAIWIRNNIREYANIMMIFNGISIFVWIIGLGTLTAGIVGVSNIMLVTVRERTNEFGVRKALGARPSSIIRLILLESIMVTAMFGYVGMVLGVGVMEIVNYVLMQSPSEDRFTMFLNPTLNLSVAVSATIVLILAGLIAGYIPARRAARLKTIDALRFNK